MSLLVIDQFAGQWHALSNFALHSCQMGGVTYPTVEHAFQAAKIEDVELRAEKYTAAGGDTLTPQEVKTWGKTVPLRPLWDDGAAVYAMASCLTSKFSQSMPRRVLLATAGAILIEGNAWHDQVWGSCRCGQRTACTARGMNQLGILLTGIRQTLLTEHRVAA